MLSASLTAIRAIRPEDAPVLRVAVGSGLGRSAAGQTNEVSPRWLVDWLLDWDNYQGLDGHVEECGRPRDPEVLLPVRCQQQKNRQ